MIYENNRWVPKVRPHLKRHLDFFFGVAGGWLVGSDVMHSDTIYVAQFQELVDWRLDL